LQTAVSINEILPTYKQYTHTHNSYKHPETFWTNNETTVLNQTADSSLTANEIKLIN